MLPGYNTNVQHQGASYHIQTEDGGRSNPCIVTVVYQGGAIVAQKKSDYRHLLEKEDLPIKLQQLIQAQHRQMIRMVLQGELEYQADEEEVREVAIQLDEASLDEKIMELLQELDD